jgi:23S rRNA (guanosine2251-2'-O)-methyltransferase
VSVDPTLQRTGAAEVEAALAAGEPVRRLFVQRGVDDAAVARVVARASERGIPVREASAADLRRLSRGTAAAPVLALVGRDPAASPEQVFAGPGAKWCLVGAAYPGNVGAALRTVEVAGAAAAFVDAPLDHAGRRAALRTSMNAERLMPVHWAKAARVVELARASAHRVLGIEDVGDRAPWDEDLLAPCLLLVGGEDASLAPALLERCDAVLRLPMRGFIPCYNLQAAVAAVALERLRQAAATSRQPPDPA